MNWPSRLHLLGTALLLFCSLPAAAQNPAQIPCLGIANGALVFNDRVICTIPQLYGPQNLLFFSPGSFFVGPLQTTAPLTAGSFTPPTQTSFLDVVNQTITSQLALLPLVAPTSGFSYIPKGHLGGFKSSISPFGPIFSERASTIGKHLLVLGFSYQHMNFNSMDGIDLRNFPTVFVQPDDAFGLTNFGRCNPVTNAPACSQGSHDYLTASNRIDLNFNQYTAFAAFGVTKRIDLSFAVPVLTVSMTAAADTSIVPNSSIPGSLSFVEPPTHGTCLKMFSSTANPQYCGEALFSNSHQSTGIGDLAIRVKGILKSWAQRKATADDRADETTDQKERPTMGLAAGLEIRVPTGDERNFLGTGAIGVRPFLVWSRGGRISPHFNLGYLWNGKSILASDIKAGAYVGDTSRYYLPRQMLYSTGIEAAATRRLTTTLDLVGQTVINGARVRLVQVLAPGQCPSTSTNPSDPCTNAAPPVHQETIAGYKGTYAVNNASLGARYMPFEKLLISGNVLLKLDNGGLRSKAIPTASLTYTFH